jgi:hypothetical protein
VTAAVARAVDDSHRRGSLDAAARAALLTLALTGVAFLLGLALPKKARTAPGA